ncbi:MAG: hypothetical protein WC602_07025 [archaeon]
MKNGAIIVLVAMIALAATTVVSDETIQAQSQITSHTIQIQLGADAKADVLEKYYLKFPSAEDLRQFILDAEKNGPRLQDWTIYDNRFFAHFGRQDEISNAKISFDNREKALRMEYRLERGIMEKADETTRQVSWQLSRGAFDAYVKSGITILPANTEITFLLPPGAVLDERVVPEAKVSAFEGKVAWKGYLTTNFMKLSYIMGKPIAQPLDTSKLVQDFIGNRQNLLILLIIALLVVIIYWKRAGIERRIEGYIVKHSSFEPKEKEDELEIGGEK